MSEYALTTMNCPTCSQQFEAIQVWEPGGVNDKGGWIVRCGRCCEFSDFYVGRDIHSSQLRKGGEAVETYEVESREAVRERYDLGAA